MKWFLILSAILANAAASVLVKSAGGLGEASGLAGILTNWRLVLAVGCYGIAFILYALAVQRLPLNVVHPVSTAGAIIVVGLCSMFLFRESFDLMRSVGYGLLLLGIIALVFSGAESNA